MSEVATVERPHRSVIIDMAAEYGMEPVAFEATIRATCMHGNVTREQFAAFLLICKRYGLNPILREIYAFPGKGGGVQPIVSIDGWMNLINSQPQFDGLEFEDRVEDGELVSVTAKIWRNDRTRPVVVTEYMDECRRGTDVWKQWPRRMLRHKAAIQCARYAFGFSAIVDPDEAERIGLIPPSRQGAVHLGVGTPPKSLAEKLDALASEREKRESSDEEKPRPPHIPDDEDDDGSDVLGEFDEGQVEPDRRSI